MMIETVLNKISKNPNKEIITNNWLTGQTGVIVDINGDYVFRFIDFINDGEIREKHLTDESKLSCPIVACGLVGYWLQKKDSEGTNSIFNGYYEMRFQEYKIAHESDDDAWERDFKKEFACRHHISNEKKLIKASEALFAYITESDQKKVKSIMANYLKFARSKRKKLYPPNHPANRIIEDTFLDAYRFGGPAYECMSWMRTEYNLPNMGPHWHNDSKTEKELLSGRWKVRHEKLIPEYVADEFEDFDDGVLMYSNGGLLDEIQENIKSCQTQEDRIRYIISLLQPFKDFAEAFYAKARIDERKRSITEHEKWIKDWEAMPEDAVDERTGEPVQPKDQILACKEDIKEYNQDIEYWKKVQEDFFWFAQHGLGAGHYREYPQEVNDEMCKYLGGWWRCMIHFARRLAALALTYGIKLMDVQERCEVYLMCHFNITDYVDNKYITSTEHARKLLDEIDAKKPTYKVSSKVKNSVNAESKEVEIIKVKAKVEILETDFDFENLKDWKDNPDLDYYLSDEHWNYHVNSLLYKNLLVFHEKELGAFLDVSNDYYTQPIKDYTSLYGNLFNEAYRLCYNVLTSPVPETKVAHFAHQAATWKFRDLKDEDGNPIKLVPNVIDLIESYHILGMANAILTFSDIHTKAVNEFLIALSVYNDNGMYFCGNIHSFKAYNETYESLILANIVNGSMLRPGYDNISRDKYLRHNIPWYEHLASILEKEKKKEKDKKTANILEQHNNNCQQFFGPTFIMPAASPSSKNKSSKKDGGNPSSTTTSKPELQHGVEYPVFSKGSGVTDDHIKAVYRLLTARGWISTQTNIVEFHRLFCGKSNNCEIIWTGKDKQGNNQATELGKSALYVLFKKMFDESLITTSSKTQKVGPILERHFVDTDGHFLTNVSNMNTTSAKADDYIKQILKTMKTRPLSEDIQRLLEEDMESKYDKNDRQDLHYRKPR